MKYVYEFFFCFNYIVSRVLTFPQQFSKLFHSSILLGSEPACILVSGSRLFRDNIVVSVVFEAMDSPLKNSIRNMQSAMCTVKQIFFKLVLFGLTLAQAHTFLQDKQPG